ncbi:MAG: cell division protein FtsQ/DivIB [Sterolibacterium sp.]|nr:cell division protein FtsQ/DivIB [Sterolibacterium sp.]
MAKLVRANGIKGRRSGQSASHASPEGLWDRPKLLDLLADVLFLCAAATLAYAAVAAMVRLPFFPLRQVVVVNVLNQVTPAQIEYAARSSLSGNFFTVNLDGVRVAFEKLPWVRKTSVRRRWPDGIELAIEEHVAAARWQNSEDEARLVNNQGEVFAASLADQAALPLFGGPEGSAPLILARYREFAGLLEPLGRTSRSVMLSARQAWQLRLDDGLTLELGRDQAKQTLHERLQRFVGIYREVQARTRSSIAAIDMRYPNGFALRLGRGEAGANMNPQGSEHFSKGNT